MPPARWGDDADSSDDESDAPLTQEPTSTAPAPSSEPSEGGKITVPPTHTSRIDAKGIKTVTSFKLDPANPNRLIKTTTKIRVTYDKVSENVQATARRKWKKFGQATGNEDQSNVTIQSRDDIYIDDPNADVDLQQDPRRQRCS